MKSNFSLLPIILFLVALNGCKYSKLNHQKNINEDLSKGAELSTEEILNNANEDFEQVLKGNLPVHSVRHPTKPDLGDGGTTFYFNVNYELTIQKKLAKNNGVDGFMYGPIIVFNEIKEYGKQKEIKSIKFYTSAEMEKLLLKRNTNISDFGN